MELLAVGMAAWSDGYLHGKYKRKKMLEPHCAIVGHCVAVSKRRRGHGSAMPCHVSMPLSMALIAKHALAAMAASKLTGRTMEKAVQNKPKTNFDYEGFKLNFKYHLWENHLTERFSSSSIIDVMWYSKSGSIDV